MLRDYLEPEYIPGLPVPLDINYGSVIDILVDNDINNINNDPPVLSYYCTCKSGARTLGTCAHIASVVWFLGYARHMENVHYPSTALLENVDNARNAI